MVDAAECSRQCHVLLPTRRRRKRRPQWNATRGFRSMIMRCNQRRILYSVMITMLLMLGPRATEAMQGGDNGTIVGRVTDVAGGAPLAAVSLQVDGTRLGAVTTSDGNFRISGIPAGQHAVTARRI